MPALKSGWLFIKWMKFIIFPNMKSHLILVLGLSMLSFISSGVQQDIERGKVIEGLSISSKILQKPVNYSVYLPPDYEKSDRSYPIVYLLHGYTDNETAWVQFGEVNRYADEAIHNGQIPPMVIAMPDAGVSWYANNFDGKVAYEDFFIKEFIPHIESGLRVRSEKQYRGLSGLSMGGYGSLLYALKHPDLFAATAPLSAAIYTEDQVLKAPQVRWDKIEGPVYGEGLNGKGRITPHWKSNNPFHIIEALETDSLKKVKYYFDCGDDDFLYKGNALLHIKLRDKKVPHEYRVRDGEHNWTYWRTGITDALVFLGENFRR